jgi:hypothetical protein
MESLLRLREPVAWALLVTVAVRALLSLAVVASLAPPGADPLSLAVSSIGAGAVDEVAVTVLAAVVAACIFGRTPRARPLAVSAVVVCGTCLLAALALTVFGFATARAASVLVFVVRLTGLVVPALAVAVLIALLRVAPSAKPSRSVEPEARPAEPAPTSTYAEPAGWEPEEASGAAWHSAGAAAAGVPASGWGRSDHPDGWDPAAWVPGDSSKDEPSLHREEAGGASVPEEKSR